MQNNQMNDIEAYDYLNARFVEFADQQRRPITPMLGRRHGVAELGSPPYMEICVARWFSITLDQGSLDVQWNGLEPPHMQVFADVQVYRIDLLWQVRCAWFNFDVDIEQTERDVRELVRYATVAASQES